MWRVCSHDVFSVAFSLLLSNDHFSASDFLKCILLHTHCIIHTPSHTPRLCPRFLIWMTHRLWTKQKVSLSSQSLQSTVQYKSVWTSLRTRVVQVTQHSVISSPFPRHRRWLLLCSNNIQFLWDSRSYSISPDSVPPRQEQRVKLLLNNEFNKWLRISEVFGWRVKLGLSCLLWAEPFVGDFSGKVTMQQFSIEAPPHPISPLLFSFSAGTLVVKCLASGVELVNRTVHWWKCMTKLGI